MNQGVFLDRASVDIGDLDLGPLESTLDHWVWYDQTGPAEIAERIAGAQVLVCNKVPLRTDILRAAKGLRLICVTATGTNNIDLETARQCGITVCNVRGYATPSVVQHVFSLVLALTTRLLDYTNAVRNGKWQKSTQFCLLDYPITELEGKTLGIIGYGELGQAVAKVGVAFGMRILVAQSSTGHSDNARVPLDTLLQQSDVVSLHCPLTEQTRGLIGERELARMKPNALLINTARGGIVDETAIVSALRHGVIGGAGFDVLSIEPPPSGHPLLAGDIPNLIVTPHTAWASRESRQRLLNEVGENVRDFFSGRPRNAV